MAETAGVLLKEAARKKIATFIFDLLVMALAIVVYGTPNHRLGVPVEWMGGPGGSY